MPFTETYGDTIFHYVWRGDCMVLVKEERRELNPRHAKERVA